MGNNNLRDDKAHQNDGQVNNNPADGMDALKADMNRNIEEMTEQSGKR